MKNMKQKLIEYSREMNKSIIIVENFNIPIITDKTDKKIGKDIMNLECKCVVSLKQIMVGTSGGSVVKNPSQ